MYMLLFGIDTQMCFFNRMQHEILNLTGLVYGPQAHALTGGIGHLRIETLDD